jgi:chromosome segregation ATPase
MLAHLLNRYEQRLEQDKRLNKALEAEVTSSDKELKHYKDECEKQREECKSLKSKEARLIDNVRSLEKVHNCSSLNFQSSSPSRVRISTVRRRRSESVRRR